MPVHSVQEPGSTRRHTYQFTPDEIIQALEAVVEQPVPQGKRDIWGLEHSTPQRGITLVIHEDVSTPPADRD